MITTPHIRPRTVPTQTCAIPTTVPSGSYEHVDGRRVRRDRSGPLHGDRARLCKDRSGTVCDPGPFQSSATAAGRQYLPLATKRSVCRALPPPSCTAPDGSRTAACARAAPSAFCACSILAFFMTPITVCTEYCGWKKFCQLKASRQCTVCRVCGSRLRTKAAPRAPCNVDWQNFVHAATLSTSRPTLHGGRGVPRAHVHHVACRLCVCLRHWQNFFHQPSRVCGSSCGWASHGAVHSWRAGADGLAMCMPCTPVAASARACLALPLPGPPPRTRRRGWHRPASSRAENACTRKRVHAFLRRGDPPCRGVACGRPPTRAQFLHRDVSSVARRLKRRGAWAVPYGTAQAPPNGRLRLRRDRSGPL